MQYSSPCYCELKTRCISLYHIVFWRAMLLPTLRPPHVSCPHMLAQYIDSYHPYVEYVWRRIVSLQAVMKAEGRKNWNIEKAIETFWNLRASVHSAELLVLSKDSEQVQR